MVLKMRLIAVLTYFDCSPLQVGGGRSDAQIMHTVAMGRTQKQDGEWGID